ncbi:hypothetical protein PCAR4_810027 [Paraburkholderia caribensis]|nr:hypothetical protein PCAR4_810027 [Paraburkholderia caribensis]
MMRNPLFYRVTAPGIAAAGRAVNVVCQAGYQAPARLSPGFAGNGQLRRGKGVLLGCAALGLCPGDPRECCPSGLARP